MRDVKGRFKSKELLLPLPSNNGTEYNISYIHFPTMALFRTKIQYFRKNKYVIPNANVIILQTEKINIKRRQN